MSSTEEVVYVSVRKNRWDGSLLERGRQREGGSWSAQPFPRPSRRSEMYGRCEITVALLIAACVALAVVVAVVSACGTYLYGRSVGRSLCSVLSVGVRAYLST